MSEEKEDALLTDTEVCEVLGISVKTLRKYLDPENEKGETIRSIKYSEIGGNRRWSKRSLEEVIY